MSSVQVTRSMPLTSLSQPDASPQPARSVYVPIKVEALLSSYPGLDQETQITILVTGTKDLSNASAWIELPAEVNLVKGDLKWSGDLKAHEPISFGATIVFHQTGNWCIEAWALGFNTENRDLSWSDGDSVCLYVGEDSGHKGPKPSETRIDARDLIVPYPIPTTTPEARR
jgi:hypothetical protein